MHRLSIKSSPSIATDPGNESFASAGREKGHPLEAQRHSGGESLQITMRREAESGDERYRIYQLLMQSGLECQERSEVYQHSMEVEVTSAIGETQYKLREVILCYTHGLSEHGKSSVDETFCNKHGKAQSFRAKIVYFNDLISERLEKSVYSLSEQDRALHLLHEFERFSNDHYRLRLLTIESMHSHLIAKWLKTWTGRKLQVIYIDTVEVKRFERVLLPREGVISNDKLKREGGVESIRFDANLVLDNNGIFAVTMSSFLRFAEGIGIKA